MRILLIEPYYSGSHKAWADGYKKYSDHTIELLTLEGRHWKWRMHGAAIEIARQINERFHRTDKPDIMLVSDMIDLTTLKALIKHELLEIPTALYFHENQLSYPYSENDTDSRRARDFHYGFINYTSALAADKVLFNSHSQMVSFFKALADLLKRLPDYSGLKGLEALKEKTSVLPLGIDYSSIRRTTPEKNTASRMPLVLWTHRWEYDKNPDAFFSALLTLAHEGHDFEVAILGAKSPKPPKIFNHAKKILGAKVVAYGKPASYDRYVSWLHKADILPVTSFHETFGISLMEAIQCGVMPLLPHRLSYPELVSPMDFPDLYYSDQEDLVRKLRQAISQHACDQTREKRKARLIQLMEVSCKYDWQNMHTIYDRLFLEMHSHSAQKAKCHP